LAEFTRQEIGGPFQIGELQSTWANRTKAAKRIGANVNWAEWNFTPYTLFTGLEKFLRNA
jgi:hypothetical protein